MIKLWRTHKQKIKIKHLSQWTHLKETFYSVQLVNVHWNYLSLSFLFPQVYFATNFKLYESFHMNFHQFRMLASNLNFPSVTIKIISYKLFSVPSMYFIFVLKMNKCHSWESFLRKTNLQHAMHNFYWYITEFYFTSDPFRTNSAQNVQGEIYTL